MRVIDLVGAGYKNCVTVGAIKYFEDVGIIPDIVMGASGGALCATLYSQGRVQELEKIFLSICNRDIRRFNPLLAFGKSACIYDYSPFWKTLDKVFNLPNECGRLRFDTIVTVTDMKTASPLRFNLRKLPFGTPLVKVLVATASIPALVAPVDGWVDGGVTDDAGLLAAVEAGADEVIVVMPFKTVDMSHPKNAVDAAYNGMAMMNLTNYQMQKNALGFEIQLDGSLLSPRAEKVLGHPVRLIEIKIDSDGATTWDFDFDLKRRQGLIDNGYETARTCLQKK